MSMANVAATRGMSRVVKWSVALVLIYQDSRANLHLLALNLLSELSKQLNKSAGDLLELHDTCAGDWIAVNLTNITTQQLDGRMDVHDATITEHHGTTRTL